MSDARFEDLLERTMGLKAASIGVSAIDRAVQARLRSCSLKSVDAYWDLLQRSRAELQQLIEAVIVPETWFFRDPAAFRAMADVVVKQSLKVGASRQLRLLSLPCSTGEEAYTMVMALLDAGLSADRFEIDAIDISERSLARAKLGVYGRNSFRGQDIAFRDRYFEAVEHGFRLRDAVRVPVRFAQGNVIDGDFLLGAEGYDVIFCRNLLIYFDAPTQNRAIGVLRRLLSPEGMLFVGHSETGLMPANGFASAKLPMAFAFRRTASAASPPEAAPKASQPAARRKLPAAPRLARKPSRAPAPVAAAPPRSIDELRRIADRGGLEEAARGCEAHMREHGPTPDALLLLGLISDASGKPAAAERYYRKALYLDPTSAEALGHLSLLLRKQGDHAGSKLLEDRMRRRNERSAA